MQWQMYIPDDGHWSIPYTGNNKREARKAALAMFKRAFGCKRLPNGAQVDKVA